MKTFTKKLLSIMSIIVVFAAHMSADDRTENIDCFILLDKSLSMVEEIDAVTDYINDEIIGKILIPGDYVMVLQFFGETEPLLVREIQSPEAKETIRSAVAETKANGLYTDIGNALDTLKATLEGHDSEGRRRYLLLITDGIQEAPPESKYYSPSQPDPNFQHIYMENSKVIRKQGWKIHVLGIGEDSAAQEVAAALSGTFSTVSTESSGPDASGNEGDVTLSQQELRESTKEFLGTIRLENNPEISLRNMKGEGSIVLQLANDGYTREREVIVKNVNLRVPEGSFTIGGGGSVTIEPDKTQMLSLDIELPESVNSTEGEVEFIFQGDAVFTPSVVDVSIHYPGFLRRYGLLILLAAAGLGVLILLIIIIRNSVKGQNKMDLDVFIGDSKEASLTIAEGAQLFLSEGLGGIRVSMKKTGEVLGNITYQLNQLILEPIQEDRFAGAKIKGNILEKTLKIKDRFGTFVSLKISRK